jgi:hypothetical protein
MSHHDYHGQGDVWSVSSSRRVHCFLHLNYGRPVFRRPIVLYANIFFGIRLSSINLPCMSEGGNSARIF